MIPQISEWINTDLKGEFDTTGGIILTGSRLISLGLLSTPDGTQRLADALRTISDNSAECVGFTGHLIAGGAVGNRTIDSALKPAWRRTIPNIACCADWNGTTPLSKQKAIQGKLIKDVGKLKALEPDMGPYLNEAKAYENDF